MIYLFTFAISQAKAPHEPPISANVEYCEKSNYWANLIKAFLVYDLKASQTNLQPSFSLYKSLKNVSILNP
jgi:hypothetical protein